MSVLHLPRLPAGQAVFLWAALLAVALTLATTACQSGAASSDPAGPTPTAVIKATATPFPPPIVATIAAPPATKSSSMAAAPPAAVEGAKLDSETADAAATQTTVAQVAPAQVTALPSSTSAEPSPSASDTPGPTYTPPAAPQPAQGDHYWLSRPVPQDTAVWTNKAYPYGSDRGGTLRTHHGVEFDVPPGTPILAAAAGTVRTAGDDSQALLGPTNNFYGNVVVVEHDFQQDGLPVYTLYGHLLDVSVSVGQRVEASEPIGTSGASGVADGAHLHFEVRVGANSYDATRNPLLWLYPFPGRGVVAGRITWPSGALAQSVPVSLRRIDASSAHAATTSYADECAISDPFWQENFVLDDVIAGYYELLVGVGDERIKEELWVYPYATSFVELTLGN